MPVAVLVALGLGFGLAWLLTSKNSPAPQSVKVLASPQTAGSPVAAPSAPAEPAQRTAAPVAAPSLPQTVQAPRTDANAAYDALAKAFPSLVQGIAQITTEEIKSSTQENLARIANPRPNDLVTGPQAAAPLSGSLKSTGSALEVNVFAASDGRTYGPGVLSTLDSIARDPANAASPYVPGGGAGVNEGNVGSPISPQTEAPAEIFTSLPGQG